MGTNHSLQTIQYAEKKLIEKKLLKKLPLQVDYKNHDICILQFNQIIFYLSHVTIFRNFVLSQASA